MAQTIIFIGCMCTGIAVSLLLAFWGSGEKTKVFEPYQDADL